MIIMVNSDTLQKSPWQSRLLGGKLFGTKGLCGLGILLVGFSHSGLRIVHSWDPLE
jgi:hypothetical protein